MLTKDEKILYHEYQLLNRKVKNLKSALIIHGALLKLGRKLVLISGGSGAGKTTMAAALISKGAKYFTDDCIIVNVHQNQMVPIPRSLLISSQSYQLLKRHHLHHAFCRHKNYAYSLKAELDSDPKVVHPKSIDSIYFPTKSAQISIKPLPFDRAYSIMFKTLIGFSRNQTKGHRWLVDFVGDKPCYQLLAPNPVHNAKQLVKFVSLR